jgi:hypothetical protein
MDSVTVRLTVEELALVFAQLGQPELGKDVIEMQLGTALSRDQVHARLMSAGNSLMASNLLGIAEDETVVIAEPLLRCARALARADFTVRYSRSTLDSEALLSYHFCEGAVFEHYLERGIVHSVTEFDQPEVVVTRGLEFFQVAQDQIFTTPPVELPGAVLEEIKDATDVAQVIERLAQAGIPESVRPLLAEDIVGVRFRGSVLRVEYNYASMPRADRGLLVLQGPQRMWLLRPFVRGEMQLVSLLAGTAQTFCSEVAALLH